MRNEILSIHKTNRTIDRNRYSGSDNHHVLSKEQKEQAILLRKLPSDFPIIGWENLNTKQQLREMKSSGLNKQDQRSLLNAKAPLAVLDQYNQAEDEITRTVYAKKVASALVSHAKSVFNSSAQATSSKSTNYTPLQNNTQQRKLDVLHNEYETKLSGKAGGAISAKVIPKVTAIVTAGSGSELTNSDKHTNNPAPTGSRQKVKNETILPTQTPDISRFSSPRSTQLPQPGPSPEIDTRKVTLLDRLRQKVNKDLSLIERVKGYNTTRSALRVVFEKDNTIERMASRYDVPKSVLQTIMFREQRFIDFRDTAADVLTDIGLRKQSSTGLMQVTTKTAIDAINDAVSKGYTTYKNIGISRDMPLSYTDKNDRSTVWSLLNSDPDFNIEVAAQIVRMNADIERDNKKIEDYSPSELINLFARYNGSGDAAQEYGTECYSWYQDFNWYN